MTTPNYNPETNTHFGCIRLNELDDGIIDQIYDLDCGPDLCYEDNYYLDETHLEGVQATIDNVTFEVFLLGGAYHLLITDSPHIVNCTPCSPCVPNAGDLASPDPDGIRTYSVPPTWSYQEEA